MRNRSPYWIVAVVATLALGGCFGDQYVTDAPPGSAKEAEKWWSERVESLDIDFLAVLTEASAIHKRNGTTATFVWFFRGRTMVGWYHYDLRLPLPLSDAALAKAKARLVGWAAQGKQPGYRGSGELFWRWEGGRGCSDQRAADIWQEAEKRCGWPQAAGSAIEVK
jgi:hypothetical protein